MSNRTKQTPEKYEKFLESLRKTGGNVARACKAEGIGRSTAYEWRDEDKEFAKRWDEAVDAGTDELEQEARRRAFKGTLKPVFYKGSKIGSIREYSDTLMIFLLKGNRPEKFKDRVEQTGTIQHNVSGEVVHTINEIYGNDGEPGDS
jgi:hypothetical protein